MITKIDYEKFIETKKEVDIDDEFSLYFNRGVEVYDQQKADFVKIPAVEIWNNVERYPFISLPIWSETKQSEINLAKMAINMLKCLSKVYEDLE